MKPNDGLEFYVNGPLHDFMQQHHEAIFKSTETADIFHILIVIYSHKNWKQEAIFSWDVINFSTGFYVKGIFLSFVQRKKMNKSGKLWKTWTIFVI